MATMLNGREMGDEITKLEEEVAKASGLVVLFGYSDDNAEFRGAIRDEFSCFDGGTMFVSKEGVFPEEDYHRCTCDHCGYKAFEKSCKKIEAKWCEGDYSWTYMTDIPHATFEIMEDGDKFCRGIVFELKDV